MWPGWTTNNNLWHTSVIFSNYLPGTHRLMFSLFQRGKAVCDHLKGAFLHVHHQSASIHTGFITRPLTHELFLLWQSGTFSITLVLVLCGPVWFLVSSCFGDIFWFVSSFLIYKLSLRPSCFLVNDPVSHVSAVSVIVYFGSVILDLVQCTNLNQRCTYQTLIGV